MSDQGESETVDHASTFEAMRAIKREIGFIAKSRQTDSRDSRFSYQFRGYEELLEVLGPLCEKHGLLTIPVQVGENEVREYPTSSGGTQHWIMARYEVHCRATSDPEDVIVLGPLSGEAADGQDKASTKAASVAYREIMFKTFSVPTRGEDHDTEDGQDRSAVGTSSRAGGSRRPAADPGQAERDAEAAVLDLGWESVQERDDAWEDLRAQLKGDQPAPTWGRAYVSSLGVKKSTLTPGIAQEFDAVMANARKDGQWKANYEPPDLDN